MSSRRDLGLLLAGAAVSTVGTSLTLLAVAIHLRPAGPIWIAAAMAAELVPMVLLSPFAGRLVDRVPNRGLLVAAIVVQGLPIVLAALVGLAPGREMVLVACLAAVGVGSAVAGPTIAAMLPHVSGEEAATRAYGWYSAITQVGFLVGFAVSGLLVEATSVRTALLLDAASFAVLAVAVTFVRTQRAPSPDAAADGLSLWVGFAMLWRDRLLAVGVVGLAAAVLAVVVVNVAEVFYILEDIGAGAGAYGLVTALWPAAGVLGGWLTGRLVGDRTLVAALAGGTVLMGAALALAGTFVSLVAVGIGWALGGAANAAQRVAINALIRSRVPDAVRGRAFAAVAAVFQAGNIIGLAIGAGAVGLIGARTAIVASGLVTAVAGGGTWLAARGALTARAAAFPTSPRG
jgi:MFS family permease